MLLYCADSQNGGYMVHGHLPNNGPNLPEWPELYRREREPHPWVP